MLDKMRGAPNSWRAKVFMGLLVMSFGVWGIADVSRFSSISALATVGDQDISGQAFTDNYRNWLRDYQRRAGQSITREQARLLGLDRAFLNDMIRSAALDGEAHKMKLAISDQQIADTIRANKVFQDSQGNFDPARFHDVLRENGLSEAGYVVSQRQSFLRRALADPVSSGVTPPNALQEASYGHRNEQ